MNHRREKMWFQVAGSILLGSSWVSEARGQCTELQMLTASDGTASDRYGVAVDIDGEVAVVGAYLDDPDGTDSGSAYVYRYDPNNPIGSQWVEEQKLTAGALGAAGDVFGDSVAVSGDVIVVGARLDDDDANPAITDVGSVYVYRYDSSTMLWSLEQKLTASTGNAGDWFGIAVHLDTDLLAIGARQDDDCAGNSGSVYVFRYAGPFLKWLNETQLQGSGCSGEDEFGTSVAVRRDDAQGDMIVAGAHLDDPQGTNSGSAYVFCRDPVTKIWSEKQRLLPGNGAAGDEFGVSVDLDEYLVVGAWLDDNPNSNAGSAYVFSFDSLTGQWTEMQQLNPSAPSTDDRFGLRVATCADTVLMGGYLEDLTFTDTGSVEVFRRCGAAWVFDGILAPQTRGTSDQFGHGVALSGNRALCGAYLDDTNKGVDSGAAYIFGAFEIELSMLPTMVAPGDKLNVASFYGTSGDLVLLVAVSVNCLPIFQPQLLVTFGANCKLEFSVTIPGGLNGLTAGFQSFKIDACGHISGSNVVKITFL